MLGILFGADRYGFLVYSSGIGFFLILWNTALVGVVNRMIVMSENFLGYT